MSKNYSDYYDTIFINRETGVEPDIAEGVVINGLIDCGDKITIGKDVFSGHDIMLLTGGHDYRLFGQERKGSTHKGPITIEEGVWLGTRCIVLQNVTIQKHAVVAAGAVVTADVPAYAVVAGVPARVIKFIQHK